jgi:hypothetical protein
MFIEKKKYIIISPQILRGMNQKNEIQKIETKILDNPMANRFRLNFSNISGWL